MIHSKPTVSNEIDNLYEEIKEQQQQNALALSRHGNVTEPFNPYLEAKYFPDVKSQPIRDHHEVFYYECASASPQ